MEEKILAEVSEQLTVAYMQAGKKLTGENVAVVAKSLMDAVSFLSVDEVKDAFRRAKMMQDIPTQRTLAEALGNLRAESYSSASYAPQIEYRDPREPWLPSDNFKKRINLCNAIKNYCAAVGDDLYLEYCRVHVKTRDNVGRVKFVNPDKVERFEAPIKDTLRDMYRKYWRKCSCAAGYPAEAPYNLGLVPPTVPEFKAMLYYENQQQRF